MMFIPSTLGEVSQAGNGHWQQLADMFLACALDFGDMKAL